MAFWDYFSHSASFPWDPSKYLGEQILYPFVLWSNPTVGLLQFCPTLKDIEIVTHFLNHIFSHQLFIFINSSLTTIKVLFLSTMYHSAIPVSAPGHWEERRSCWSQRTEFSLIPAVTCLLVLPSGYKYSFLLASFSFLCLELTPLFPILKGLKYLCCLHGWEDQGYRSHSAVHEWATPLPSILKPCSSVVCLGAQAPLRKVRQCSPKLQFLESYLSRNLGL